MASQEVSSNKRCCGSIAIAIFLPDPEELGIKVADVIEVRAPFAVGASGHAGFGVVVLVDVPAVGGDLGDQIVAPQQRLPQPIG